MEQCKHGGVKKWCSICKSLNKKKTSTSNKSTSNQTNYECIFCKSPICWEIDCELLN